MATRKPEPVVRPVRIDGGVLCLSDGTERGEKLARRLLAGALKHLPDGPYELEVRPFEETRRARANAFYWVFLTQWSKVNGHTKDELHEIARMRHNSKVVEVVDPATGEVEDVRIGMTTAKLSIEAFSEYLERVMVDAAEMDGFVMEPKPHEDWRAQPKGRRAA
jgi:hypothetical protein